MGIPSWLDEVIRIAAVPVGAAVPGGAIIAPGMLALANQLDKEDTAPEALRKAKEGRRKKWVEFAVDLGKDTRDKLKKHPEEARSAMRRVLDEKAAADLRVVIKGDILETEGRIPGDQEVNILADAVSARAREAMNS